MLLAATTGVATIAQAKEAQNRENLEIIIQKGFYTEMESSEPVFFEKQKLSKGL